MNPDIIAAIEGKQLLRIHYEPGVRTVEPHALGRSSEGKLLLRAYQTEGASSSGESENWKLFRLDRILQIEVLTVQFAAPRPEYRRGDTAMKGGIFSQL